MALVGGLLAVVIGADGILSIGSLVGFFTVFGIAARNGILMINHFQHLERFEGVTFGPELVMRGALERLSPILMTTLATGLALVPLVVAGNSPGHEIEHPLAVVIVGGLVTSTLLNLFVVPVLYLRFARGINAPADDAAPADCVAPRRCLLAALRRGRRAPAPARGHGARGGRLRRRLASRTRRPSTTRGNRCSRACSSPTGARRSRAPRPSVIASSRRSPI